MSIKSASEYDEASGLALVSALCRRWNTRYPNQHPADHFGMYRRIGQTWRSPDEGNGIRMREDLNLHGVHWECGNVLLEFRYSERRDVGHYSFNVDGRRISMHSGPEDLFQVWSHLSLLEAWPSFSSHLNKTEEAWVGYIENRFISDADEIEPDRPTFLF